METIGISSESNQSVAQKSLRNETIREGGKVIENCETTLNNILSIKETDNESNKSFLLKKFLQTSNKLDTNKKLVTTVTRPVPKPRKSKNNFPEKVVNLSPNNSACSQNTYIVENDNYKSKNIDAVDVIVHNNSIMPSSTSKSFRKDSSECKTYVKNLSYKTEASEEISTTSTNSEKINLTDYISSSDEPKDSGDKSNKSKIIEDNNQDVETNSKYTYEKIVEIIIHKTDVLQLDSYVTHPTVKVHIVDINTGKYYLKSSKSRSVVFYYENEEQDYILPVMTSSYNLQEKRTFSPEWEESILLNEDFSYLTNENVIVFFEVLDYIPSASKKFHKLQKYCYKGWHRITFAFLKLVGRCESLNINKKVKLQLFYPEEFKKRDPCKCDLWYIWKANKLKIYPSALYVTIKEVISPKKIIETFRSKTPLQKENITLPRSHKRPSHNGKIATEKEVLSNTASNCSKETFSVTNKALAELDSFENGCFILKFSNNGLYLGSAVQIKDVFTIIVFDVNSFEEICSANEHSGLIYSINWSLDDSLLITASADNTVVIWNFSNNSFFQILPHPIYVYTSYINSDNTMIATGCYDTTVRIWLYNKHEEKYELHQEMEDHEGFVTSVCFNKKSVNLYSSDSRGHIFEWSVLDNSDWKFERDISTPDIRHTVINEILLFPNERKILVHSRDSILRIISIKKACVLYWLQGALNSRIQTFCSITSCGKYVTSGCENGLITVWDSKTGKDVMTYEPFLNHLYLEPVHCACFHPKDNVIAFSHYGSVSPILLYQYNQYNETKGQEMKQKNTQYLFDESGKNFTLLDEKSRQKEKVYFHDILEKMDKLLT